MIAAIQLWVSAGYFFLGCGLLEDIYKKRLDAFTLTEVAATILTASIMGPITALILWGDVILIRGNNK